MSSREPAPTPSTVVVLPTYDERENLPVIIGELLELPVPNLRVLVVDDASPDGTGDVADRLALDSGGQVAVLHRDAKDGLGRAYVAGMEQCLIAGADIVVQMDADLSHPPAALPQLVEAAAASRTAVAIGSRYVDGARSSADWPLRRRLLSRAANAYVRRVLGIAVADSTSGFRAWNAALLRRMDLSTLHSRGYAFQIEMTYRAARAGAEVTEVPIEFCERLLGRSKMSLGVQAEAARLTWQLRRDQWRPSAPVGRLPSRPTG